jgi:predicted RND superfamily exporter protein
MNRFFRLLRPLFRTAVRQAPWIVGAALLVTGVGGYLAGQLHINTDFSELLPSDYDSVRALEKLRETVGGESEAAVVIASPSFDANKRFAEDLIPRALDLRQSDGEPFFSRVDYERDEQFMERNALYFATWEELSMVETYLQDEIDEAKREANPFFFELDDEAAGEDEITEDDLRAIENQLTVRKYPISADSTIMVLRFYPTGAQTNIGYIERAFDSLRGAVSELSPSAYHPEMTVEYGGRLRRQLLEIQAITQDVRSSLGAGIGGVLLIVMFYFGYKSYRSRRHRGLTWGQMAAAVVRLPVAALVIGLPLGMSLAWTFGFAYLIFGMLNLMTSTLGLVLFGLGIDYGIHFYARYMEERGEGHSVMEAADVTFMGTGQAIAGSALTTAAALYVLVIADFRGFSEFGVLAGTGIIFALIAMLFVLPALIRLLEDTPLLELSPVEAVTETRGDHSERFRAVGSVLFLSVAATVAAIILIPRVGFEYDFGQLEPEYSEYDRINQEIGEVYSGGNKRNPAYIIAESDEDVQAIVGELRQRAAQDTTSPTILSVETLQERFPRDSALQRKKLQRIADIRQLLDSQYLEQEDSEELERLRRAAQTIDPIPLEQVPEYLAAPFRTTGGTVGNLVIVYPSVGLSDARQSMAFARDVGTVTTDDGKVYHAGSTSLVAADMFRVIQSESPWMVALTFIFVVLLMLLIFRSTRWAGLALLPLVIGVVWMLGLTELFGLRLNFYNLVVLPAILGIGNDAGVHVVHRYRESGTGSIRGVLRSTGEHVMAGGVTTMVGFSGLLLSFHPGLQSMGLLAVIGIGSTLLAAVLFLPALLQWMEDRRIDRPVAEEAAEIEH